MTLYFRRAVVPCIFNILLHPNDFVDNVDLNISNSCTHIMLVTKKNNELNVIRCSPYITDVS